MIYIIIISNNIIHINIQNILYLYIVFYAIHLPNHIQWWWWSIKFKLQRSQSFLLLFSKSFYIIIPGSSIDNLIYIIDVIVFIMILNIAF